MSTLSLGKRSFLSKIGIRKLTTTEAAEIAENEYKNVLLPLAQKLRNDLLATPNASTTALDKLMTDAANEARSGKYDKAVGTLGSKAVKKAYALAKVTAQGASKKQQSEALFKVKYAERKQKVEEAIQILRTMPGTGDVQEVLRQSKVRGEGFVATSPPEYEKAFNALVKPEDKLKEALKASKETLKAANAFPAVKSAIQTFDAQYLLLEALAPEEELREIKAAQVAAMALITTGKKNKTDTESANDCAHGMAEITSTIKARIKVLNKAKDDYEKQSAKITEHLEALQDCATERTLAPYADRLKRAATLVAQHRYDQAAELVKSDAADLKQKLDVWPAARSRWNSLGRMRQNIKSACEAMAECPAAEELHQECSDELARLRALAEDEREDSYEAAAQGLEALQELVNSIRTDVLEPYGKLGKLREKADQKVQAAARLVQNQLTEVQNRIKLGGGPENAEFGEFNKVLAESLADWQRTLTTAIQPDDLTADAKVTELQEIGRNLEAAASDLDTYTSLADSATLKADKAEFDKVRVQVDQAMNGLSELGGDMVNNLLVQVRTFYAETERSKDYKTATTTLRDEILRNALRMKRSITEDRERALGEANTAFTNASNAIDALKNTVGDSKYKAVFKGLHDELEELKGMVTSPNLDTVKDSLKEIQAFVERLAVLRTNLTGKGPAHLNFQKVEAAIAAVADTLDNSTLKKWRNNQFLTLSEKYAQAAKDARSKPPEQGLPLLNTLKTEIATTITAAETAASWFETFEADRKIVKKSLDKLAGADEYVKSLKEKLKGMEKEYKAAQNTTKEGEIVSQLSALKIEVNVAVSKPAVRQEKETEIRLANAQKLQDEATFKGLMEIFKQGLYKEARAVGKDKTALKNLEARMKGAQKVADSGDFKTATQQLDSAKALAEQIKANPRGFAATARGNLKAMRKVWVDAVGGFSRSLDNVYKAIEKDSTDTGEVPGPTLTLANQVITDLKSMFNPLVFDKAVNILQDKKVKTPQRRAAREDALRTVREYMKIIQTDPMIIKLSVGTPYKPPIASSGLYQALVNLDLNIRRCI